MRTLQNLASLGFHLLCHMAFITRVFNPRAGKFAGLFQSGRT